MSLGPQLLSVTIGVFGLTSYLRAVDSWPCPTPATAHFTIAIIDSAVDAQHPSLRGLVADQDGRDFLRWRVDERSTPPRSTLSHGTAMAVVATRAAGPGGAISILPLTVATESAVDARAVAEAIDYAGSRNRRVVVNLSMNALAAGIPPAIASAIERNKHLLFVVAAGNQGRDTRSLSASLCHSRSPTIVCVAAVDRHGVLTSAPKPSNYGPDVDVAAPGVDVELTDPDGRVSLDTGTSLAAAHVSGVAARVWSTAPDLPAAQIAEILCESSTKSDGPQTIVRCGVIDSARATGSAARTCSLPEGA